MKRGQVTPFIIIAIIIVISLGVFLLVQENILEFEKVHPDVQPIYNYVENCVNDVGEDALFLIAQQGGYVDLIKIQLSESDPGIAVYFDKGENKMPSKEIIEEQLSLYMDFMVLFCVGGFEDFPDFTITGNEASSEVRIENDKVIFNVNLPLSITKGENTYTLEKYKVENPVRLGFIYDIIAEIVEEQLKNPDSICIDCLYTIAEENDLFIQMFEGVNKNEIIFSVRDEKSKVYDEDYIFHFLNKY